METKTFYYETKQSGGFLYRVPLERGDIRIRFEAKYGWVGPRELRLREIAKKGGQNV